MDYHEDDEALLSSQVVEEEDLLFDESHPEQELKLELNSNGSNESKFAQRLESDETLRVRLAGPSTNKASEYVPLGYTSSCFMIYLCLTILNRLECRWWIRIKSMKSFTMCPRYEPSPLFGRCQWYNCIN